MRQWRINELLIKWVAESNHTECERYHLSTAYKTELTQQCSDAERAVTVITRYVDGECLNQVQGVPPLAESWDPNSTFVSSSKTRTSFKDKKMFYVFVPKPLPVFRWITWHTVAWPQRTIQTGISFDATAFSQKDWSLPRYHARWDLIFDHEWSL